MKNLPIDTYLEIEHLSLHERISERRNIEFQPGCKKFCTKNEIGEISTELRKFYADQKKSLKKCLLG